MRHIPEDLFSDIIANLKFSVAQKHMDEAERPIFREACSNLLDRLHQIQPHDDTAMSEFEAAIARLKNELEARPIVNETGVTEVPPAETSPDPVPPSVIELPANTE